MDLIDAIRSWIQENRENVIEEMDSDVIDTTCNLNNMEAVSTEIGATLSTARGRKEKAELFLDFELGNDEYLKALKKTLEENGMRVGSNFYWDLDKMSLADLCVAKFLLLIHNNSYLV